MTARENIYYGVTHEDRVDGSVVSYMSLFQQQRLRRCTMKLSFLLDLSPALFSVQALLFVLPVESMYVTLYDQS